MASQDELAIEAGVSMDDVAVTAQHSSVDQTRHYARNRPKRAANTMRSRAAHRNRIAADQTTRATSAMVDEELNANPVTTHKL